MTDDFGDILKQWEKQKGKKENAAPRQNQQMIDWLNSHPPKAKAEDQENRKTAPSRSFTNLKKLEKMPYQAELDLHGLTQEEAEKEIDNFLLAASKQGFRKILLIHGKGYHSPGQISVLKKLVRQKLEASPLISRFGKSGRTSGGDGATWAVLK